MEKNTQPLPPHPSLLDEHLFALVDFEVQAEFSPKVSPESLIDPRHVTAHATLSNFVQQWPDEASDELVGLIERTQVIRKAGNA